MSSVQPQDVQRMADTLYIGAKVRSASSSRFWVLLCLSAVIAASGVIADSTATVIGAMIVAPLMTPILGTALAVVLADRSNLTRSVVLVLLGALAVIIISLTIGAITNPLDDYTGNTQVSGRINPGLIDLLAALATGMVGAFALVRSDISDTLPGVAIAISLVPPLAVVGLLIGVGRYADAAGAGLLFATNFAAIVATGTAVLLAYRVRDVAMHADVHVGELTGRTLLVVTAGLVLVAIPLAGGSWSVARDQWLAYNAAPIASSWADRAGWQLSNVTASAGTVRILTIGLPPEADPYTLRTELDEAGLNEADLVIELIAGGARYCQAGSSLCTREDS
jgi:uncharacterized hydrophobic protein (TIGR00271 family)